MHLVDTDGNVANRFTDGVPGTTQATVVDKHVLNAWQEELANAVLAGGATLIKDTNNQLAGVLRRALLTSQASDVFAYVDPSALVDDVREIFVSSIGKFLIVVGSLAGNMISAMVVGNGVLSNLAIPSTPAGKIYGIASNGTTVVAVGTAGKIVTLSEYTPLSGWTNQAGGQLGADDLVDVKWVPGGGGRFVCISGASPGRIQTSPDGVTWTQRTNPVGSYPLMGLAVNGATVIAGMSIGGSGSLFCGLHSTDGGVTWATTGQTYVHYLAKDPVYVPGLKLFFIHVYLSAGINGSKILKSADGITWTQAYDLPLFDASMNARLIGLGGQVIWATDQIDGPLQSIDGATWAYIRHPLGCVDHTCRPFFSPLDGRGYFGFKIGATVWLFCTPCSGGF